MLGNTVTRLKKTSPKDNNLYRSVHFPFLSIGRGPATWSAIDNCLLKKKKEVTEVTVDLVFENNGTALAYNIQHTNWTLSVSCYGSFLSAMISIIVPEYYRIIQ